MIFYEQFLSSLPIAYQPSLTALYWQLEYRADYCRPPAESHLISAFSEFNKSKQLKMFTSKSISKRNKSFVYHIEVKISDETYFVEMIKQKLSTSSIYSACTSSKCNAKVILTVTGIPIVKVSKYVILFFSSTHGMYQMCVAQIITYVASIDLKQFKVIIERVGSIDFNVHCNDWRWYWEPSSFRVQLYRKYSK